MYKLTLKGKEFTIPKENIGLLAFTQAQDRGQIINPRDADGAIKYLESIGIEVSSL